jgi:hypothetical protein
LAPTLRLGVNFSVGANKAKFNIGGNLAPTLRLGANFSLGAKIRLKTPLWCLSFQTPISQFYKY